MSLLAASSEPIEAFDRLAIAIKRIQGEQLHCGFLYNTDEAGPRFAHLAFHFDLRDEKPDSRYRRADCGLDEYNKAFIASMLPRITNQRQQIPYSVNSDGISFNPATGVLNAAPLGKGLTCATFIIAVFRTYGFQLVREEEWKLREEDVEWRDGIVEIMCEKNVADQYIDAMVSDGMAYRIRPDEVTGASTEPRSKWPLSFEGVEKLAQQITDELDEE